MNNALPIVIDGIDHQGALGERLGRLYTLQMSDGATCKAYLIWDSGEPDYFFSSLLKKRHENTPNPEAHLSAEKCPWLPPILQKFDEETLFGLKCPQRGKDPITGVEPSKAVLGS